MPYIGMQHNTIQPSDVSPGIENAVSCAVLEDWVLGFNESSSSSSYCSNLIMHLIIGPVSLEVSAKFSSAD